MQLNYNYNTTIGAAGGIVDLAPHYVRSFINEAANGAMLFGMGVTAGTLAGQGVKVPATADTAGKFEGIVTNRRTTELNLEGGLTLRNKCALGVMQYGVIYGLVADNIAPAYGDATYLITSGDEAGYFTNAAAGQGATFTTVAVKGRFVSTASDGVAAIELYNQAQV